MVKNANLEIVAAILKQDSTVKSSSIERVRAVLTGNPEPKEPTLLTQNETAEFLKVSRQTIWIMTKAGQLKPVILPNGLKRYRMKDLKKLLNLDEEKTEA